MKSDLMLSIYEVDLGGIWACSPQPVMGQLITAADTVGLSVRARNVLKTIGAKSFDDLCGTRVDDLLEIRGCGTTTLCELRLWVLRRGMDLRGFFDVPS